MQDTTLARPYAKAAFEFALEDEAISSWENFLQVASCVVMDPQVNVLKQKNDAEKSLFELIESLLGKSGDQFMKHFLMLLVQRKRLSLLPAIFKLFQQLKLKYEKKTDVDVYSVTSLTPAQLQEISQKMEMRLQHKVTLQTHIDPNLLGGVLIRAGDVVIDGSLRGRLDRLTATLID